AVVGDDPGEYIESADRAFRVGKGRSAMAQRQIFAERHDVDAVLFEDGTLGEVDPMHRQEIELVAHAGPSTRQKARPHPVGHLAQAQIDAGGLDLVVTYRLRG